MRYWWVNQNQTYEQEFKGGYIWSPKRRANNSRNPFYEFMREVSPGNIVLSFKNTNIVSIAVISSHCYESPKPEEFGTTGSNWSDIGWRADLRYFPMSNPIRPADHMQLLGPLLPERYSPLQSSGRGQQSVYLTELAPKLATALIGLLGHEARVIVQGNYVASPSDDEIKIPTSLEYEEKLASLIAADDKIPETERQAVVIARRGQGKFKKNVQLLESRCRITGVDRIEHLTASHCKPWRDCSNNKERLDGENGLLLTPSVDHLFDRGFISFESSGKLLISPVAHKESLRRMGVPTGAPKNVGAFSTGQKSYLEFHRECVFLRANLG